MSNKLSDRIRGVNLLSIPQSPNRAGFVQTTIEDPSSWPVVDGVKQKDGWVYLDGSTIDNSSGKYNEFVALNGGDSLPEGPFETDLVDLTLTTSIAGFNQDSAFGQAYKVGDQWRLDFSIKASMSNTSGIRSVSVDGVTFYGSGSEDDQVVPTLTSEGFGYVKAGLSDVRIDSSIPITSFMIAGDVALNSKPTWADANISQYPIAKLYSDSGSVSISTDNLAAKDVEVSGDLTIDGDLILSDGSSLSSAGPLVQSGVINSTTNSTSSGGSFYVRDTIIFPQPFKAGTFPVITFSFGYANYSPAAVKSLTSFVEIAQGGTNPDNDSAIVTTLSTNANISFRLYWVAVGERPD